MELDILAENLKERIPKGVDKEKIKDALLEISNKHSISVYEAYSIVEKMVRNNYHFVKPKIWKISERNTRVKQFRDVFVEDMERLHLFNDTITDKGNSLRLMTYNIHFWTEPHEREINHDRVMQIVDDMKPDILCLQEVLIPGFHETDCYSLGWHIKDVFLPLEVMGYEVRSCRASKFQSSGTTRFGNVLAVLEQDHDSYPMVLDGIHGKRCAILSKVNVGTEELAVCCVHLDVRDKTGNTRREQIKNVMRTMEELYPGTPKIMVGDFNCMKEEDYTEEEHEWIANNSNGDIDFETVKLIESKGYRDLYTERAPLKYTVWTGRRVDFVFVKDFPFEVESTQVYYSSASDHLPLIVDLRIP